MVMLAVFSSKFLSQRKCQISGIYGDLLAVKSSVLGNMMVHAMLSELAGRSAGKQS